MAGINDDGFDFWWPGKGVVLSPLTPISTLKQKPVKMHAAILPYLNFI